MYVVTLNFTYDRTFQAILSRILVGGGGVRLWENYLIKEEQTQRFGIKNLDILIGTNLFVWKYNENYYYCLKEIHPALKMI